MCLSVCLCQSLSKGLVSIASSLNHSKELRDFFVDLLETVSIRLSVTLAFTLC